MPDVVIVPGPGPIEYSILMELDHRVVFVPDPGLIEYSILKELDRRLRLRIQDTGMETRDLRAYVYSICI